MKITNKINLILSSTLSFTVVGSLATILIEQKVNNLKSEVFSDGFSIVNTPTLAPKKIIRNQLEPSKLNKPSKTMWGGKSYDLKTGKVSNNSKTLILNDNYFINFYKTQFSGNVIEPKEPPSIIMSSRLDTDNTEKKIVLPIGTIEVVSAIEQSQTTHIIGKGDYNDEILKTSLGDKLTMGPSSGTHLMLSYSTVMGNDTIPLFTLEKAQIMNYPIAQEPTLSPVYEWNGKELVAANDLVYMFQQNYAPETTFPLKSFSFAELGYELPQTNLDVTPGTKIFGITPIRYKDSDSSFKTKFIVHHSSPTKIGLEITIFDEAGKKGDNLVLDKDITSSAIDMNNLMSSAKIVDNVVEGKTTNFELFYALTEIDKNKIFSTKINPDFSIPRIENQPSAIDLSKEGNIKKNISQISYQEKGEFEDGTINIPVKYDNIGIMGDASHSNGLINWKETNNSAYWNQDNFDLVENSSINNISDSFSLSNIDNALSFSKLAILMDVDPVNNKVTYNFSDGIPRTSGAKSSTYNYNQIRNFENLSLNYHTKTPTNVITKISEKNPLYVNVDPNEINNRLLSQIQSSTDDLIYNGQWLTSESRGIELSNVKQQSKNPIPGSIEKNYKYSNGSYDVNNQFVADNPTTEVVFLQEPENSYFPLSFNFNLLNANKLPSTIVHEIENIIGLGLLPNDWQSNPEITKLIGYEPDKAIQISYEYLPFLTRVKLIPDDMMGTIKIDLSFDQPNSVDSFIIDLNSSGFAAYVYLIAIIVPIIVVLIGIILLIIFLTMAKKKKVELSNSLQAGFALSKKMSVINPNFKNKIVSSNNQNTSTQTNKQVQNKPLNQTKKVVLRAPNQPLNQVRNIPKVDSKPLSPGMREPVLPKK